MVMFGSSLARHVTSSLVRFELGSKRHTGSQRLKRAWWGLVLGYELDL